MRKEHFRPGKALQARSKSLPVVDRLHDWALLLQALKGLRLRPVISSPDGEGISTIP